MQSPACHVVLCTWISRSIFNASLRAPGKTFHAQHEVVGRQTLTSYVAAVPSRWCRTPMSGPITAGPHPFSLCRAFVAAILGRRTTCTFQSCCGTAYMHYCQSCSPGRGIRLAGGCHQPWMAALPRLMICSHCCAPKYWKNPESLVPCIRMPCDTM